jgi:hypothetical protein
MTQCPLCSNSSGLQIFHTNYFLCPVCDLRFLDPALRLKREDEEFRYRQHNNDVDDPAYRKFLEPVAEAVRARVKSGEGLDFGAGPGPALANMLSESGLPTLVYDPVFWPNEEVLKRKYDFVTTTEAAEHFFDPAKEFATLSSLIKPAGWLAVMTLLYQPSIDFAEWYYPRDPTHVVFYSAATFIWIANQHAFEAPQILSDRTVMLRKT